MNFIVPYLCKAGPAKPLRNAKRPLTCNLWPFGLKCWLNLWPLWLIESCRGTGQSGPGGLEV